VLTSRAQLKLFDHAMRLETRAYSGPYLPKERARDFFPRSQEVIRLSRELVTPLGALVGNHNRVADSVNLSAMPSHPHCVADLIIYPSVASSVMK